MLLLQPVFVLVDSFLSVWAWSMQLATGPIFFGPRFWNGSHCQCPAVYDVAVEGPSAGIATPICHPTVVGGHLRLCEV